MNKIFKYFLYVIPFFISIFLRFFLKTKKNLAVFGCRAGWGFEGNAKYMFIYGNKYTNLDCIWITKDKELLQKLKENGYKALYYYSVEAIITVLRAKYIFITHGLLDIPFCFLKRDSILINLWHGIPIKKISFCDKNIHIFGRIMDFIRDIRTNIFISNSEFFNKFYLKCFKIRKNSLKVCGLPRINFLINPEKFFDKKVCNVEKETLKNILKNKKKVILYAPTFRDYEDINPFLDVNFLKKLDNILGKKNLFLILKLHPFVNKKLKNLNNLKSISFLPSNIDIYEILPFVNTLISDYSSIIIDFLIAYPDKELILFCYDLENYKKIRGFLFDFEKVFSKFIVTNTDELIKVIEKDTILKCKNIGENIKKFYNIDNIGKECKKIFEEVIK